MPDNGLLMGDCRFCDAVNVSLWRLYDTDAEGEQIIEYACAECEMEFTSRED